MANFPYSRSVDNIIPIMTSGTTPAPIVITASSNNPTVNFPWNACDGDPTTSWWSLTNGTGQLKVDMGSSLTVPVVAYTFTGADSIKNPDPRTWNLVVSNDNLTWYTVDSKLDDSHTAGQLRKFVLSTPSYYRYYVFDITSTVGGWTPSIYAFELLKAPTEFVLPLRGRSRV